MSGVLINLLVQIVAGAIGGNIAGAVKDLNIGTLGNTIAEQWAVELAVRFSLRFCQCLPNQPVPLISEHWLAKPQGPALRRLLPLLSFIFRRQPALGRELVDEAGQVLRQTLKKLAPRKTGLLRERRDCFGADRAGKILGRNLFVWTGADP